MSGFWPGFASLSYLISMKLWIYRIIHIYVCYKESLLQVYLNVSLNTPSLCIHGYKHTSLRSRHIEICIYPKALCVILTGN